MERVRRGRRERTFRNQLEFCRLRSGKDIDCISLLLSTCSRILFYYKTVCEVCAKFLEAMPILIQTTRLVLVRNYLPYQAFDLFSIESLVRHAKVSHSGSFLSSLARERVPFGPSSILLTV